MVREQDSLPRIGWVETVDPKGKEAEEVNIGKRGEHIVRTNSSLLCISGGGGRQGSGGGMKTKTTTITRTVNDLRQLIRPKAGGKPKTTAAKVNHREQEVVH